MYDVYLSEFHDGNFDKTTKTFKGALAAIPCRDCECGGGHIEVDGRVVDLYAMPDAVLSGDREPTEEEVAKATGANDDE